MQENFNVQYRYREKANKKVCMQTTEKYGLLYSAFVLFPLFEALTNKSLKIYIHCFG